MQAKFSEIEIIFKRRFGLAAVSQEFKKQDTIVKCLGEGVPSHGMSHGMIRPPRIQRVAVGDAHLSPVFSPPATLCLVGLRMSCRQAELLQTLAVVIRQSLGISLESAH